MSPLKALLENKPFYAEDLTEAHRGLDFKCPDPDCRDDLIVVIPVADIIKHFRHKTKEVNHATEPETLEHRAMKTIIRKEAIKIGLKAEYEVKVYGYNNHQIDVLIPLDYIAQLFAGCKALAFECQCSQISLREHLERNRTYQENGLRPVWVLGENYYQKPRQLVDEILTENGYCFFYVNKDFILYDREKYLIIDFKRVLDYIIGYYEYNNKLKDFEEQVSCLKDHNNKMSDEIHRLNLSNINLMSKNLSLSNENTSLINITESLEHSISTYKNEIEKLRRIITSTH